MSLLFIIQNTLQDCKNDSISQDCNNHGLCQEDNTCSCYVPWYNSDAFCTDCEPDRFQLSDDGIRCVNINSCTNQAASDFTECSNNHGFCEHVEENNDQDSNFFCRCRNHYVNETSGLKPQPTYCSECQKSHYETVEKTSCVPKECINNFNKSDTSNIISCSGYGLCVDLTNGEIAHDTIVDVIVDVVNGLLDKLNIPIDLAPTQCLCKAQHMSSTCDACEKGYTLYESEESTNLNLKCYQNDCFLYDENHEIISDECSGAGVCSLNSNNVYTCTCDQETHLNYNTSSVCTECNYNYDINTQCMDCIQGYDIKTQCSVCLFGFSTESQCTECLQGFQMSEDGLCNQCEHNMDPLTRCTACPEGLTLNKNGDCIMQTSSTDVTAIVFGCIFGVIILIILIAILVKYLQNKRAKKIDYSKIQGAQDEELERLNTKQVDVEVQQQQDDDEQ